MSDVNTTLDERQKTHGDFRTHAVIAQDLKLIMHSTNGWAGLTAAQKEGLEMIQHKIARILNGSANFDDHYLDIAGYAERIRRTLPKSSSTLRQPHIQD